jgi:acyl-CoA thioester hydrolase
MPLDDYPIRVTLPVLWGNQDLFGHVNNCIYIRWFECSRVAYWDHGVRNVMGLEACGPILANVNCNFKKQVRYPDTVHVGSRIVKAGNTSLTMEHAVYSETAGDIAASGHSIVVMFDYNAQRPIRISDELRKAIEETEGKPVARK